MASGVFNVAKGRHVQLGINVDTATPSTARLVAILLVFDASFPSDATIEDVDTVAALIALANVAEATFTNYARQELGAAAVAIILDDTANEHQVDIDDLLYSSAGGAANNTLQKLIIAYDNVTGSGDDTDLIPLSHHDVSTTTDGNNLTLTVPSDGISAGT